MRQLPSKYTAKFAPALTKSKRRAVTAHVEPPIDGLSVQAQTATAKAKVSTASILTNFYVDEDRIYCRAGYVKVTTMPGGAPVEHLIPHYGVPERLVAASGGTLYDAMTGEVLRTGFTNNEWHWTAFSNLGADEYTVMVNGADGVWEWDGGSTAPSATPVVITKIEKTNPARCTVGAGDIAKFEAGMTVLIAGADVTHDKANGYHEIAMPVGVPNTFVLVGVDLSGAAADQTTGTMTASLQGSFSKLAVYPPVGNTWLDVNDMHIVVAHMNRLWFADEANLAVWYLPLQSKSGTLEVIPLNSIFKRGGTINAMATWTVDGGMGMDDQLVIFTTNGECAIYSGVDPDTDLGLVGVYRFGPVMSKHSTVNYGGELFVLIPNGMTPMTSMMKAGKDAVDMVDHGVASIFLRNSIAFRENRGWELFLNPSTGRLFANTPLGGGRYDQMIRHMPKAIYSQFKDIPSRCWAWADAYVYFGDDKGSVYRMHPQYLSDDGAPIRVDVQTAWSQFKTSSLKHFKMLLSYVITNGDPRPFVEVMTDYSQSPPINQPELSVVTTGGSVWDEAVWNEAEWTPSRTTWSNWNGVSGLGRVGAIRLTASVANCSFAITGWDVLFEEGTVG